MSHLPTGGVQTETYSIITPVFALMTFVAGLLIGGVFMHSWTTNDFRRDLAAKGYAEYVRRDDGYEQFQLLAPDEIKARRLGR